MPRPRRRCSREALALRAGRKVELVCPQRGERRQLVAQAPSNARLALARRLAESSAQAKLLRRLAERLDLPEPPARVEVYDNSHIMGTDALGAFIVAGPEGLNKAAYRKFTIRSQDLTPGDDYAMMREVLTPPLHPAAAGGSRAPERPVARSGDHRRRARASSRRRSRASAAAA